MPINKLTDRKIRSISEPGRYSDGGGLYLRVRDNGTKTFVFITSRGGKQTEHTIGPYGSLEHEFTLSRAREERDRIVEALVRGERPSRNGPPSKRQETAEIPQATKPSFGEFAISYVHEIESEFRNPKHRAQWHSTLRRYCEQIWDLPID